MISMIRTILFFLLISTQSFGQINGEVNVPIFKEAPEIRFPGKMDSIILGDWYLKETIIAPMFSDRSSSTIREVNNQNRTISISNDSLIIHRNERYYTRDERFAYELLGYDITFFQGKKKKREQVGKYEIVSYSPRELVISSQENISNPFDFTMIIQYYVYYRKEKSVEYETMLDLLQKEWRICSNEYVPFPSTDSSFLLKFNPQKIATQEEDICKDSNHVINLSSSRDEYNFQNTLGVDWYSGFIGGGTVLRFYFDSELENIVTLGAPHVAYKLVALNENQLTLELNRELTEELNAEAPKKHN